MRLLLLALLTVVAAGCTEPSPLEGFQRDNPRDLGSPNYQLYPPSGLAATLINDGTFGVSWRSVVSQTVTVLVERKLDDHPFVAVGEVDKEVRFLSVPITGPGNYTFRAASREPDGTLGSYAYTGTFTIR